MVLMVFFSSRISPLTSTVIFLERSPLATAVVTSAMLRTWLVRLLAIELTLSVRSFQVPATPFTLASPPSFPSVPTSRATRVTSEANELSWSTIELTIFTVRRNSPFKGRSSTCSVMRSERSPFATAPITRAISLVGRAMSSISRLVESISRSQEPEAAGTAARCIIFPSLPTTRLTRSTSLAVLSLNSMMSLSVSAILPASPVHSPGKRTEKSPFLKATRALSSNFVFSESFVRV